jgi:hypothetical protein
MNTPFPSFPLLVLLSLMMAPAIGWPASLHAQVVPVEGSLIRVLPADGGRWEGRYMGRSSTHLMAEGPNGPSQWAVEDIQGIHVGVGPHRPVVPTMFATSGILAAGLGLLGALSEPECEYWCYGPQTRGEGFVMGALVGAVLGLPVGFVIGLIPRERWVEGVLP